MPTEKRGVAYTFLASLGDSASPGKWVSNPTILAGDFKISKDDGAFINLATLPTVSPASSKSVKFSLTVAEMTADKVIIIGSDAAGDEWDDISIFIDVPLVNDVDIELTKRILGNNSTIVVNGDTSRTVTVFEEDGTTVAAVYDISANGLVRTRTT